MLGSSWYLFLHITGNHCFHGSSGGRKWGSKPLHEDEFLGHIFRHRTPDNGAYRKECQSAWACWLNGLIRLRRRERRLRVWLGSSALFAMCVRPGRLFVSYMLEYLRGAKDGESEGSGGSKEGLTVVEGISSVLQWGVHDAHGKMVLTGWSGGDRCLFEWLWCLVWYSDWVLSCRIPWRNQDAESDYQRIGATNSGGSSKGLGKEVLLNANCDQVQ